MKKLLSLLLVVGLVFFIGCIGGTDSSAEVNSLFKEYDSKYNWDEISTMSTVTDYTLGNMQKYENQIATLSNNLNENEKSETTSCLSSMSKYRNLINISQTKLVKLEQLGKKINDASVDIGAESYVEALDDTAQTKEIITYIKNLEIEQNSLNIIIISQDVIGAYDLYYNAMIDLEKSIGALQQNNSELALQYSANFTNKYTEGIELSSNTSSVTETNLKVANWYQTNIGKCVKIETSS